MAQVRDFRMQTGVVTAPVSDGSPNKIAVYANASGILLSKTQSGTIYSVGQFWTGDGGMMTPTPTGLLGNSAVQLTLPNRWLPVIGPSGQFLLIPAYLSSTGVFP